ncbi:hypothetical protein BJX61DRAFT_538447 [Aspergillus egyptiacus]|nr:hypothetical protein BJX61DRAFT_538447 [Aspergillus egyptiacus]
MPSRALNLSTRALRGAQAPFLRPISPAIPVPMPIAIRATQTVRRALNTGSSSSSSLRLRQRQSAIPSQTQTRPISTTQTRYASNSGKSQADLIVEELQELYETTTDELEIATESTEAGTIYASSDRASARDALENLVAAYELYTSPHGKVETARAEGNEDVGARAQMGSGPSAQTNGGDGAIEGGEGGGPLVELAFDPRSVSEEAREEVKRRIGQRIREVRSAVERLEGMAHD